MGAIAAICELLPYSWSGQLHCCEYAYPVPIAQTPMLGHRETPAWLTSIIRCMYDMLYSIEASVILSLFIDFYPSHFMRC